MWQLASPAGTWWCRNSKNPKNEKSCAVTTFSKKRFFTITFKNGKMEALFAHARDQKLPTQSQINLHVLCVCVLVTCGWHGEIIYKVISTQNQSCGTAVPQNRFFEAPCRYNVAVSSAADGFSAVFDAQANLDPNINCTFLLCVNWNSTTQNL